MFIFFIFLDFHHSILSEIIFHYLSLWKKVQIPVFFLTGSFSFNFFNSLYSHLFPHHFYFFTSVHPVLFWVFCSFLRLARKVLSDVVWEAESLQSHCHCVWFLLQCVSVWRTLTGFLRVVLVFRRVCRSCRWGWWEQQWWKRDWRERNLWRYRKRTNLHWVFHKLIHKLIKVKNQ